MKPIFNLYKNAYGGLSQSAWMLALIMFINRTGTMVVPFLSIYLTAHLGFDLKDAGIILSLFGLGSICGTFIGGYLSDKVGHFWVQSISLFGSGVLFILVGQLTDFYELSFGIFILAVVAESLRPANASSVSFYAKPENITRAFALNRMALNLGFSLGPAIGGALAAISYKFLFMADAFSCIIAGVVFFLYFRNKKGHQSDKNRPSIAGKRKSPYSDGLFVLFAVCCSLFAIVFFQLFTTLPLYYREVYHLSEGNIGLLLAMNGLVVFIFEMIFIYLVGQKASLRKMIVSGVLLNGFSFLLLNWFDAPIILYVSILLMSFAEILAMPFMATLTVQRSGENNRGGYMALYTMAYAVAHVLAPFLGTRIIANFGYDVLWWASGLVSVIAGIGFYFVIRKFGKTVSIAQ